MKLTEISVNRPVATTMFFLIIIVLGFTSYRYLPVNLLPPIEYPQLTVSTEYPNVGPEEIEEIITEPVENALSGISGVEKMTSDSEEGESDVTLEFAQGTDLSVAANEVRAALDELRDEFPPEVESPQIRKFDPNDFPIVIVGVNSAMSLNRLTQVLDTEVRQQFEQIAGVGSIDVWGGIYREVHLDLNRDRLIASNLSSNQVLQAIATENVNLPGGNITSGIKQLYVRTQGQYESLEQIENTVITVIDGKPIRVENVANVNWGYEDLNRLVTINGEPMLRLGIRKQSGANTVAVAQKIREEVKRINQNRDDMELMVTTDQSVYIQDSISNVQKAAIFGGLFAICVLYFFLRRWSSTLIISTAIPISIIATFALLYFNDLTLNQMSLGGLALGIGLIVDNAIVVLENIVRRREEHGDDPKPGALVGTKEVAGAIIASTLTTCVIFLPVVFMQTVTGIIFKQLALVVVFALLCSLLVALTLIPMLASKFLHVTAKDQEGKNKNGFKERFSKIEKKYSAVVEKALYHKRMIFGGTSVLVVLFFLLTFTIPVELAPQTDANQIDVNFEMAQGTNIAVQNRYLQDLERIVRANLPMEDIKYLTTSVSNGWAEVEITMVGASERSRPTSVIADSLQKAVSGKVPGVDTRVSAQSGLWMLRRLFGSGGNTEVSIQLRGYNLEQAQRVAREIRLRIEEIPGITGSRVERGHGRPEQNINFNREKISNLGLTVREVAQVIQTNVGGSRAGSFRQGGDEFPIIVRLRTEDRQNTTDLGNISVKSPSGEAIPVSALTSKSRDRGPTEISRINGRRVSYITANLESGIALGTAIQKIQDKLSSLQLPAGFTIVYGGAYQEQQEAAADFRLSILMALFLIYMVMAAQFERFIDPLIVMLAVPLAVVGVVPTLLLTGTTINMQSLMGIVMLIGIVANNAIVLIDYINLMRREHDMNVHDAVIESARLRLRPILMTTLTTILGLLPLALGWGAGAELQAALARVVIGGLTAATLITLVFVPVVYVSTAKVKERVRSMDWSIFKKRLKLNDYKSS